MIRTLTTIALALALGLTLTAAPALATDDNGGTPVGPCVTKGEFGKVQHGMSKPKVHRIFGTAGWQSNYETGRVGTQEHRQYKACDGGTNYIVQFTDYNRDSTGLHVTKKMRG